MVTKPVCRFKVGAASGQSCDSARSTRRSARDGKEETHAQLHVRVLQDEDRVLMFRLDVGPALLRVCRFRATPAVAMSPDQKVLYVAHRNVPGISATRWIPRSAEPECSATPEAALRSSTDRTGRFLLGAYYQGFTGYIPLAPMAPSGGHLSNGGKRRLEHTLSRLIGPIGLCSSPTSPV